jgi:hypothetical protein
MSRSDIINQKHQNSEIIMIFTLKYTSITGMVILNNANNVGMKFPIAHLRAELFFKLWPPPNDSSHKLALFDDPHN